jgi:uncharacterized protein
MTERQRGARSRRVLARVSRRPACDTGAVIEPDNTSLSASAASDVAEGRIDPLIESFDSVCRRLAGFNTRIDTEWADGYLTAIAAGPRAVPDHEWLAAMAGDAFERTFADPEDLAQATSALTSRMAQLRSQLDPQSLLDDEDRVQLAPLMLTWDDEARRQLIDEGHATAEEAAQLQAGAVWAEGFFAALEDFSADWPDPDADDELAESYHGLLETVAALAWDPAGDEFKAFAKKGWKDGDPTRDELIDEACFAIQDLRLYWLDHQPKPPPRRVEALPGRNDPCPCGSGRKFKKCHGAAA